MKNLWERYKTFMVEVVLRKILIPAMLTITYFLAVGLSTVVARIFMRRQLNSVRRTDDSWWMEATGNEANREKCLRQS